MMSLCRSIVILTLWAMSLSSVCASPVSSSQPDNLPKTISPLLEAVVNISVLRKGDSGLPDRFVGSGFLISSDGFVVTNNHVVSGAYAVTATFLDGRSYPASVIATNRRPDLALLKILPDREFSFVSFGDSDDLQVGQTVIAIGNPIGLNHSVSVGVISALNRDIQLSTIDDFIQTDAAINHGNSGGPLFDTQGRVIGINTALWITTEGAGSAGLGFAIPSRDASWVIDQMRRFGRVRAGFLGVRLQDVSYDLMDAFGLQTLAAGLVAGVMKNAPADQAGLKEGDVIIGIKNRPQPKDARALLRQLEETPPGEHVEFLIVRDGREQSIDVLLSEWPQNDLDPVGPQPAHQDLSQENRMLGIKVKPDPEALKDARFFQGEPAVSIASLAADSPAANAGLMPGDILIKVGQRRVFNEDDAKAAFSETDITRRGGVPILVLHKGNPKWFALLSMEVRRPKSQ
jgi:serine protease Do